MLLACHTGTVSSQMCGGCRSARFFLGRQLQAQIRFSTSLWQHCRFTAINLFLKGDVKTAKREHSKNGTATAIVIIHGPHCPMPQICALAAYLHKTIKLTCHETVKKKSILIQSEVGQSDQRRRQQQRYNGQRVRLGLFVLSALSVLVLPA